MGTSKDFRVKTGLVVEDGDVTLASDHTVKAGTFDTNIAAAGVTLTGTTLAADGSNSDINIAITPKGTGEVDITKVDIASGAIDGTTIGATSAETGAFTTLSATGAVTATNTITVGVDDTGHDVKFFGAAAGNSMLWDESANQLKIVGTGSSVALDVDTGDFTVGAYGLTNAGAATIASMAANWTNAGRTVADLGTITTVDINGGTVDGATVGAASASTGAFTTLAASGATTLSGAVTLGDATDDDITNTGRWVGDFVPKVDSSIDLGTSTLQFAEAHIDTGYIDTVTAGSGGFTVGTTVITDDSIVMTPTTSDTLSITATTHGASTIATADGSGGLAATLTINAAGTTNLQYNGNSKVTVGTGGIDVTGKMDATGTVSGGGFNSTSEQTSAGTGIDLHSSATIRAKEDSGVYKDGNVTAKFTTTNIENANFRGSMMTTDDNGISGVENNTVIPLVYLNLNETDDNIYHSVDIHCSMQEKVTSGNVAKKWLSQNLKASYDGNTVYFQTSDSRWTNLDDAGSPPPGEFCAQKWADSTDLYLVISYCPYDDTASSRTVTYSVNANGLSMPINEAV